MNGQAAVSLGKIIKAAEAGELGAVQEGVGGCVYEDSNGRHCAIGCLLSREILDDIKRKDIMHVTFDVLNNRFPNIVDEIGFTKDQGLAIQNWHDVCYAGVPNFTPAMFIEKMKDLVSYKVTKLSLDPFNIAEEGEEDYEPEYVSFEE